MFFRDTRAHREVASRVGLSLVTAIMRRDGGGLFVALPLLLSGLQCRLIFGVRVQSFILGRHLRFGNCGGLRRRKFCRGSRCEVKKCARGKGEGEGEEKCAWPQALYVCRTRTADGRGL